jgi:putative ABC transport system permease protein
MLSYAVRSLARAPGYTAATVVILALGIGANTGAFSAIRDLVWKPLSYPAPDRLMSLFETTVEGRARGVAEANLLDWRAHAPLFDAMAAYRPRSFGLTLTESDAVTVIQTGQTMAALFRVAAVAPALGRVFTDEEEAAEAHTIVLTDRLWRRMFGADPSVVGRVIQLNEEPYAVLGVMPRGFEYPMGDTQPDAFIPLSRRDYCCGRIGSLMAAARLKPGVSVGAARAELQSLAAQTAAAYPDSNRGRSAGLLPLAEAITGARRESLLLLYAAASLLLLIACANVAGLTLARWNARNREVAIRVSLGAGLPQLAAGFFAEAALLTAAGTGLGFFASAVILGAIPRFVPGAPALRLDGTAFLFALSLACAVTALLSAAPLLVARRASLSAAIRSGGTRLRSVLAVAQVALSVALLLGAGLLLRSFLLLVNADPGFETAHAFRFGIGIPEKRYDTEFKQIEFHRQLLARLAAIPGVSAAGAAGRMPLGGDTGAGGTFQIAGAGIPAPRRPHARTNLASPGYFAAMGIPLIEGRVFSWREDRPGGRRVALVNQAFARAYLRGREPVGTPLELAWVSELNPRGSLWEIAGMVGDTRQNGMDREPAPEIFLSMTQAGADGAAYAVRTRRDDPAIARAIAAAVAQQDPRIERVRPAPLETLVERNLDSRHMAIELIGGFGALALLLTAAGIYGIVAFRATARAKEMAIRMALGAESATVRGLVVAQALRIAGTGLLLGAAAFWLASPLLLSQLYGVGRSDAATFATVAAIVLGTAIIASAEPSRRAGRADPARLLREN